MAETTERYVGNSVPRKEDAALLTGRARWTDNLKLPGMLHLGILRSPYAHARIKSIDVSAAREQPGVVAVFTGEDLAPEWGGSAMDAEAAPGYALEVDASQEGGTEATPSGEGDEAPPLSFCAWPVTEDIKIPNHWPVARSEVNFAGDPVAVVVATDRYQAQDALEFIEVDYEPLEVVTDPEAALAGGALVHEKLGTNESYTWALATGDVEDAFSRADVTIKERYLQQRVLPSAIETRGTVVNPDPMGDGFTVYSSTQIPHILRSVLSAICSVPEQRLRVVAPDVGGGFGGKLNVYAEEVISLAVARKLGTPVKWIGDRSEDYLSTIHGRGQVQHVELAATSEGKLLGMRVEILTDMGAYLQLLTPGIPLLTAFIFPGVYSFGAFSVRCRGAFTNKTPTDSYRGAGRAEGIYGVERAMDALARRLGMDPAEIRRRNYHEPFDEPVASPAGLQLDSGNYGAALEKALDLARYDDLRAEQRRRRESGDPVQLGIGLASYTENGGLSPSKMTAALRLGAPGWETASIRMLASGKVQVVTGTSPHGQGHVTSWSQIAADALGVSLEDVEVLHGDTSLSPYGLDTYGSRSLSVGGVAVYMACEKVVDKAKKIAAHMLEAAEGDIEFEGGRFSVAGSPDQSLTMQGIAGAAYLADNLPEGMEPVLSEEVFFDPPNFTYPFGTHVCVVEVDTETGFTRIRDYFGVDDCGPVINPAIVNGQLHGGIAQGIGQALYEEAVHDADGNLVTGTMVDYLVPGAPETPNFTLDRTYTPSPTNAMGVKGTGESGTIASTPAVVNAVIDGLAHLGVDHIDMPAQPWKVWQAIQDARGRSTRDGDAPGQATEKASDAATS